MVLILVLAFLGQIACSALILDDKRPELRYAICVFDVVIVNVQLQLAISLHSVEHWLLSVVWLLLLMVHMVDVRVMKKRG